MTNGGQWIRPHSIIISQSEPRWTPGPNYIGRIFVCHVGHFSFTMLRVLVAVGLSASFSLCVAWDVTLNIENKAISPDGWKRS